ncbi:hypothetical protein ACFL5G_05590 [Candidatus Margulisiibacteriota bacterium]
MKRLGLFCLLLLLYTPIVLASPTVNGPTGLVTMPTAEGLRYKEFNTGFNYIPPYHKGEEDDDGVLQGKDDHGVVNYYGNLGTLEGMELGFTGRGGREGVFINLKYYLISDNSENPLGMAVGVQNLSSFYDTGVYMVASKQLNMNMGLHLGFLGRFYSGTSDTNMMFGMKYFLNENWALVLDTVGEQNVYGWNIGMHMQLGEEMILNMAALNLFNPVSRLNSVFTVGLSYTGFM